jgi:hypothetical protein
MTAYLQLVLKLRIGGTVLHSPSCPYGVPKDNFTVSISPYCSLLGDDTRQCGGCVLVFQVNMSPSSSKKRMDEINFF